MFDHIANEIAAIKTRKFHVTNRINTIRPPEVPVSAEVQLPQSYREFVARFGGVSFYRVEAGYRFGVLRNPAAITLQNGNNIIRIGHFNTGTAYFKTSLLVPGSDSPVFEGTGGHRLTKRADSFGEWVNSRTEKARLLYGKRGWQKVLDGPAPFTLYEESICNARKKYSFKIQGFTADGNVEIMVKNGSDMVLPYLTVGARSKNSPIAGAVFLNVSKLQPGDERIFVKDCYKDLIPRENLELFNEEEPIPEERELFWEFKPMPGTVGK